MSENNDEINQKLNALKEEADERKSTGTVLVGDHEVKVVAKDNGTTVAPNVFDRISARVKSKAKDTYKDVFVPWVEDLAFNTLDDFLYRLIYRRDGQPPVRNGGGSRRSSGYTDYGWHSSGRLTSSSRSASSSREDPYSHEDAEIYRSIILDNIGEVEDVFREINRVMDKYGCASIGDAYTAAQQSSKIQSEDFNYGWSKDRYPNGLSPNWSRMNGRDRDGRPVTVYRCRFPEPEEIN